MHLGHRRRGLARAHDGQHSRQPRCAGSHRGRDGRLSHHPGSAIDAAKASGAEALNFLATPLFSLPGTRNNAVVMERIAAVRLPAIFQWPETAEAGALAGYGPRFPEMYRQRARIVVRILRGAKPADMPIEQPARFQLVINLKAAKALGHEVPAGLVLRADEVIE